MQATASRTTYYIEIPRHSSAIQRSTLPNITAPLDFLYDLLDRVLIQPLVTLQRVIAVASLKLLEKSNQVHRPQVPQQSRVPNYTNLF